MVELNSPAGKICRLIDWAELNKTAVQKCRKENMTEWNRQVS